MKKIILIVIALQCIGCIGKKRLARLCNQYFPPSIETRTGFFQEDSLRVGTYYLPPTYKPFLCPQSDTGVLALVPCPGARVDTLIRTQKTKQTVADSGKIYLLSQKIAKQNQQIQQLSQDLSAKKKMNRWMMIVIAVLLVLMGAIIGLSLRKTISRLFKRVG
jgi:hypothetical protein